MRKIICPININTKAKAKKYFRGINFTLIPVPTVTQKLLLGVDSHEEATQNQLFPLSFF